MEEQFTKSEKFPMATDEFYCATFTLHNSDCSVFVLLQGRNAWLTEKQKTPKGGLKILTLLKGGQYGIINITQRQVLWDSASWNGFY